VSFRHDANRTFVIGEGRRELPSCETAQAGGAGAGGTLQLETKHLLVFVVLA
jgi:hypothetical protein